MRVRTPQKNGDESLTCEEISRIVHKIKLQLSYHNRPTASQKSSFISFRRRTHLRSHLSPRYRSHNSGQWREGNNSNPELFPSLHWGVIPSPSFSRTRTSSPSFPRLFLLPIRAIPSRSTGIGSLDYIHLPQTKEIR